MTKNNVPSEDKDGSAPMLAKDEALGQLQTNLAHYGWLGLGWTVLVVGMVALSTPLPLGTPLLAAGSIILIRESDEFRHWLRNVRQKNGSLHKFLTVVEGKMPTRMANVLKRTHPKLVLKKKKSGKAA